MFLQPKRRALLQTSAWTTCLEKQNSTYSLRIEYCPSGMGGTMSVVRCNVDNRGQGAGLGRKGLGRSQETYCGFEQYLSTIQNGYDEVHRKKHFSRGRRLEARCSVFLWWKRATLRSHRLVNFGVYPTCKRCACVCAAPQAPRGRLPIFNWDVPQKHSLSWPGHWCILDKRKKKTFRSRSISSLS